MNYQTDLTKLFLTKITDRSGKVLKNIVIPELSAPKKKILLTGLVLTFMNTSGVTEGMKNRKMNFKNFLTFLQIQ